MSVNSLTNFGVPGLSGERGVVLQPIITSNWRVTVYGFGMGNEPAPYDITRHVKQIGLPGMTFSEAALRFYTSTVYINTRFEWDTIQITLEDDIMNTVFGRFMNQVNKQFNFYDQTMSRAGENYKFEMEIDILAGGATAGGTAADPNIIRKYSLAGCWISKFNDGDLNYDNSAPKTISATIRFDNAIPYNHNGIRMGQFSHTPEIQQQIGALSTGAGAGTGSGIGISGSFNGGGGGLSGNFNFNGGGISLGVTF